MLHYVPEEKVVRVVFALNERTDRARREAAWDAAGERVAGLLREHARRRLRHHRGPQRVLDVHLSRADHRRAGAGHGRRDRARDHRHAGARGAVRGRADRGDRAADAGAGDRGGRRAQGRPGRAGTVVAYKFGRQAGEVAEALRETGRIGDAVWGSALGLPEESVRPAAELDGAPLPYLVDAHRAAAA